MSKLETDLDAALSALEDAVQKIECLHRRWGGNINAHDGIAVRDGYNWLRENRDEILAAAELDKRE